MREALDCGATRPEDRIPHPDGRRRNHCAYTQKSYCKAASAVDKNRVVAEVHNATGITASAGNAPNHEKISWNEVRQLNADPRLTIGEPSLYHDVLSCLEPEALGKEIRATIDKLETNGQRQHYDDETISVLRAHGITCPPSTVPGLNTFDADLFHLRRIMVGFSDIPFLSGTSRSEARTGYFEP